MEKTMGNNESNDLNVNNEQPKATTTKRLNHLLQPTSDMGHSTPGTSADHPTLVVRHPPASSISDRSIRSNHNTMPVTNANSNTTTHDNANANADANPNGNVPSNDNGNDSGSGCGSGLGNGNGSVNHNASGSGSGSGNADDNANGGEMATNARGLSADEDDLLLQQRIRDICLTHNNTTIWNIEGNRSDADITDSTTNIVATVTTLTTVNSVSSISIETGASKASAVPTSSMQMYERSSSSDLSQHAEPQQQPQVIAHSQPLAGNRQADAQAETRVTTNNMGTSMRSRVHNDTGYSQNMDDVERKIKKICVENALSSIWNLGQVDGEMLAISDSSDSDVRLSQGTSINTIEITLRQRQRQHHANNNGKGTHFGGILDGRQHVGSEVLSGTSDSDELVAVNDLSVPSTMAVNAASVSTAKTAVVMAGEASTLARSKRAIDNKVELQSNLLAMPTTSAAINRLGSNHQLHQGHGAQIEDSEMPLEPKPNNVDVKAQGAGGVERIELPNIPKQVYEVQRAVVNPLPMSPNTKLTPQKTKLGKNIVDTPIEAINQFDHTGTASKNFDIGNNIDLKLQDKGEAIKEDMTGALGHSEAAHNKSERSHSISDFSTHVILPANFKVNCKGNMSSKINLFDITNADFAEGNNIWQNHNEPWNGGEQTRHLIGNRQSNSLAMGNGEFDDEKPCCSNATRNQQTLTRAGSLRNCDSEASVLNRIRVDMMHYDESDSDEFDDGDEIEMATLRFAENPRCRDTDIVRAHIMQLFKDNNFQPLKYYRLIIDPNSIIRTANNALYISNLMRQNVVIIQNGKDFKPEVRLIQPQERNLARALSITLEPLTIELCRNMIIFYDIQEPLLKSDELEVHLD